MADSSSLPNDWKKWKKQHVQLWLSEEVLLDKEIIDKVRYALSLDADNGLTLFALLNLNRLWMDASTRQVVPSMVCIRNLSTERHT